MPDLVVSPTTQSLAVTQTVQALTMDALPALTINQTIPLNYSYGQAVSNVSMVSPNQFYSGVSISLSAGVWLVWGQICCNGPAATYSARISDLIGSNIYGGAEVATRATSAASFGVNALVSLNQTNTVYLMAAASIAGCSIRSTTPAQSLGGCTAIHALRVSP